MRLRDAAFALLFTMVNQLGAMDIVRDGRAETAIVIPDDALPSVQLAAEELQYHVRKATGAELGIYPQSEKPDTFSGLVYVGNGKAAAAAGLPNQTLDSNCFIITCDGHNLYLLGNDLRSGREDARPEAFGKATLIGTLSAVYEFLEKRLGVRWLWPGELGEFIPTCKTISVDAWDRQYRPRFVETQWGLSPLRYGKGFWPAKESGEAHEEATRLWSRRQRFCIAKNISGCHAYNHYWERFGKTHPEFFALLPNGKREPIPGDKTGTYITMCVSSPALRKQIMKDWVEHRHPPWSWQAANGYDYLPCGDGDAPGMCMCENCRAWDADDPRFKRSPYWTGKVMPGFNLAGRGIYPAGERENEPSLSDRYARFYIALYEEAAKINPDVMITGSAYVNYADPPTETKLNDRICISIVPPGIFPQTEKTGEAFRQQWQGWRDTGAVLKLRPNITHAGHNMPVSYTRWLHRNFTFAAENGMIATGWDSLTGQWATQGPTLYLLARLHVRPEMTREAILDEYYAAFGPAKNSVKTYFDYWENVSAGVTQDEFSLYRKEESGGDHRNWLLVADRIFTPDVTARGRELMENVKAVQGLDQLEQARVAFIDNGLCHAELTLAALRAVKKHKSSKEADAKLAAGEALRALFAFRSENQGSCISNMGYLAYRERASWDAALAEVTRATRELPEVWKFRFDPGREGEKKGWQKPGFDDASWEDIRVNACWEEQVPGKKWKETHGKDYDGIAWYRTRFSLRPDEVRKDILLTFGAVDEACVVYVNGEKVHTRIFDKVNNPGGWDQPFTVDISRAVNREGENTLAVRVEDQTFAGGVWKPVSLTGQERAAAR